MSTQSIDIRTLTNWSSWFNTAMTGEHTLAVSATGTGYQESAKSTPVTFNIYGKSMNLTGCTAESSYMINKVLGETAYQFVATCEPGYTMTGAVYTATADGATVAISGVTGDGTSATVTLPYNAITGYMQINVQAQHRTYTVTKNATNCTISGGSTCTHGTNYEFTVHVNAGFDPDTLTVTATAGGQTVPVVYDEIEARWIAGSNITGNVVITAIAGAGQLQSPQNVNFNQGTCSWDEVADAGSYNIYTYDTTTQQYLKLGEKQ